LDAKTEIPAEVGRPRSWERRELLRAFIAAAGLPLASAAAAAAARRRTVGIVGGGMAGVSLAWLLEDACDVVLLEARSSIGGNVQTIEVDLDGRSFAVDMGAQFFHPGPYPTYTALLTHLGLYPPRSTGPSPSHSFPASITVSADGEPTPRFVSPVLPDRAWPLFAPWNQAGIQAFALAFGAAKVREQQNASWALTLEEWLPTLGLPWAQWEATLLPWAASLFSGSIDEARGLSARAAMIFAAKALPANPLDPVLYYVLSEGMGEVLRRLLAQSSTVEVVTGAAVQHVVREPQGRFTIRCHDGRVVKVDDLVFAASGPGTLQLLESLPGTAAQQAALRGIEFHDARLALHTDPVYASSDPRLWSFLNCGAHGAFCEASMWLAPVLADVPPATAAKVWKSWITHRQQQPTGILHEAEFRHMLPTPATVFAQNALWALQGRGAIWFAGGYLLPYDSQETALLSALAVAIGLQVASSRCRALLAASESVAR
jgi:predicted NAD/FAD-binding protein